MKILIDKDRVVRAIGESYTDENGVIFMNGAGYALYGQQVVEVETVPEGVVQDIYQYFNGNFVEYTTAIDKIKQDAIDEYTLTLINGGIIQ